MLSDRNKSVTRGAHWGWLLPILALSPLSLAAKGCGNSSVVGDDCPDMKCMSGGTAGSAAVDPGGGTVGKTCGGLLGAGCEAGLYCAFAANAMCGIADQTGVCKTRPEVCDDVYAPVCGCDGKTYGNDCEANGAGTSVAKIGVCAPEMGGGTGDACGGQQGLTCDAGEYCNFPPAALCGAADQSGVCAALPQGCTKEYVPVCGCDDKTYGNACEAASAGVSVASAGECAGTDPGAACGTRGGTQCDAGQYCQFDEAADCGRSDAPGKCIDIPTDSGCLANYDPVCGCDGMTYGNACEANLKGVSIDYSGECSTATCGGFIGAQCDAGYFCNYPPEMACGIADGSGVCLKIPEACDAVLDPVCGCDGENYSNACEANMKGTSVLSKGKCQ